MGRRSEEDEERLSLETAVTNLLDETWILLPGTQTLLEFQLIVVFESSFHDHLTSTEQNLHFAAMLLTIVAIALIPTPAAYRLQVDVALGGTLPFLRPNIVSAPPASCRV